jgi:hypothetical protein
MPASDSCEAAVIRALDKAGWAVEERNYAIRIPNTKPRRYVFADLRLIDKQTQRENLVVEIKCFAKNRPLLDEFYHALGQYLVYRTLLQSKRPSVKTYLCIPLDAEQRLLKLSIVRTILKQFAVDYIVVDIEREVVVRWST